MSHETRQKAIAAWDMLGVEHFTDAITAHLRDELAPKPEAKPEPARADSLRYEPEDWKADKPEPERCSECGGKNGKHRSVGQERLPNGYHDVPCPKQADSPSAKGPPETASPVAQPIVRNDGQRGPDFPEYAWVQWVPLRDLDGCNWELEVFDDDRRSSHRQQYIRADVVEKRVAEAREAKCRTCGGAGYGMNVSEPCPDCEHGRDLQRARAARDQEWSDQLTEQKSLTMRWVDDCHKADREGEKDHMRAEKAERELAETKAKLLEWEEWDEMLRGLTDDSPAFRKPKVPT
jgi:hypothetical protein